MEIKGENQNLEGIRLEMSSDINKMFESLEGAYGEIVVLKHLPRMGKTYNLLEYLNDSNYLSLYVSDIHTQMDQIADNFNNMSVIKGLNKICPVIEDQKLFNQQSKDFKLLFTQNLKGTVLCKFCRLHDNCIYHQQFDFPIKGIVSIAKESLQNRRITSNFFNYVVFDENMVKARTIKPYYRELDNNVLDDLSYGSAITDMYQTLQHLVKGNIATCDEIKTFEQNMKIFQRKKILRTTLNEIRNINGLNKKYDELSFLFRSYESLEWMKKGFLTNEFRDKYYKPYIHYAFDLLREYGSNIIIANATFEEDIYNQLKCQYPDKLPSIKEILKTPIQNKNSYLLHYNQLGRSCSKTGLEEYGSEIFPMIHGIHRFCSKRGLKSGLITFNEYEEEFQEFDVIDHFVAHRGKNDFDNVNVLVILGTFNIPRIGILEKNYAITGEYLQKKDIKDWKTMDINGCKIAAPQNEKYRNTRLYLLKDEHLQAILRSGAHIKSEKLVIVFGYVPMGVEKIFNYKIFRTTNQLVNGYLTNICSKGRKRST